MNCHYSKRNFLYFVYSYRDSPVWLSCTWTNSPTRSTVQIPYGHGRASAKTRTIHTATKKQYVQILLEKLFCKFFTKASECLPGMSFREQNQSIYRNRLQMTAPQLTKNGFYLSDVLYRKIVAQILSNRA